MIKFDKWMLPDGETHLQDWMKKTDKRIDGRLAYQYSKYEEAMKYVKQRRVAVDVGAHVGLWSWYMARDFRDVGAFEPVPEHRDCWQINMNDRFNADVFSFALGEKEGRVAIGCRTKGSSGDTGVIEGVEGTVEIHPLDKIGIPEVDFMKIDCEGYELPVLKGAVNTLTRWKPVVVVEQKGMETNYGFERKAAVKFLQDLGAKLRAETSGDYILAWD